MRYLWGFGEVYFGSLPPWVRFIQDRILSRLRKWDVETNAQVNHFLCISKAVRDRIRSIYSRDAAIVYPPVDAEFFNRDGAETKERNYYLVVAALTPYKRTDLVVEAFNGWDRELLIVGDGPSKKRCEKLRKTENIRFLGAVSDKELRRLYRSAKALVFPQEEDFGIVPLEAQACGTPVIAYAKGGALETVGDGVFFEVQSAEAIRKAVLEFESKRFDSEALRRQAVEFDKPQFKTKIRQAIENAIH